jgi:hypothetical protein
MAQPDALAWAIDRDDVPVIRAALHDLKITRASMKRELRWQTLVLKRADAIRLGEHLPPGWLRGRIMLRVYGGDVDADDRETIRRALDYRSASDSTNAVYMGSLARAILYQVLDLDYGRVTRAEFDGKLAEASRLHLDQCMNIARSVIMYMENNQVSRCPCCGQIVPAKVSA